MVTIILDTDQHPGGKQYGWIISGYADFTDRDGNESGVSEETRELVEGMASDLNSEVDSKAEAKRELKTLAKELITDPLIDAVSVHVEGTSWLYVEKSKPRKKRAKKSNPAQGTLFGIRRR